MKNFTITFLTTLFVSLLLSITSAKAQSIPGGTLPSVGDITESIVGESDGIEEGESGNGVTWDFSNMVPMALSEPTATVYVSPEDTPHAAVFPTANLAIVFETTLGNTYTYYRLENNRLEYVGGESLGTFIYFDENPQLIIDANMSSNEILVDDFVGLTDNPSSPLYTTGEQGFEINGQGTLILPSGTYSNAVRLVNTVERVDSTGSDFFSSITRTSTTSYMWLIAGQVSPVMTISYVEGQSESIVTGNPPTITEIPLSKSVVYNPNPQETTTATTDINRLTGLSVEGIAPNPTSDFISISLNIDQAQMVSFKVSNLIGRTIKTENKLLSNGISQYQINLSDLPCGTYLLSIYNEEEEVTTLKVLKH